ncbi:MAG: prepilin-type N-terminal cleavage/methylation domain-containing protein [Elusimicrobia bacterium]|nr:prepilin-type N-terminal cleavage/methylation domain-containing protein [Elusimicrobiota bacterium]
MKRNGFTLVELVVTIMIVIVLSAVSVPLYKGFTSKAKIAEGNVLLGRIRDAQLEYYNEYRNFLWGDQSSIQNRNSFSCKEDVLGIDARTNKYFTMFQVSYGNNNNVWNQFLAIIKSKDLGTLSMQFWLGQNATTIYQKGSNTTIL